jgi:hypothetical protein
MLENSLNEIAQLCARFPILATVAEHKCAGKDCPCFTVLERLQEEYSYAELEGSVEEPFVGYVERRMRENDANAAGLVFDVVPDDGRMV